MGKHSLLRRLTVFTAVRNVPKQLTLKGKELVVLGLIHNLYVYLFFLSAKLLIIRAAILHGKILF